MSRSEGAVARIGFFRPPLVYLASILIGLGTPVPGRKPTTAIVTTGPYRVSRNPIYLAFTLLQLGIALLVGSWWLLLTLAPGFALLNWVVVPREERSLEARFGDQYRRYKVSVRRWL